MTAPALIDLERKVARAAEMWVDDQDCAAALATLEDAVTELKTARKRARQRQEQPT